MRTERRWICFNTCSSCEEQPGCSGGRAFHFCFNTCSSCEEQLKFFSAFLRFLGFNTCSSCEEQLPEAGTLLTGNVFQYMLLLRGATSIEKMRQLCNDGFQYMLLLRGATHWAGDHSGLCEFQYMLLLRGATWRWRFGKAGAWTFQYMLLLRGATGAASDRQRRDSRFNTCSSCEEQRSTAGRCLRI